MTNLKVVKVTSDYIEFDNGIQLSSYHERDCCENHYLNFNDLNIEDFEGLIFDLTGEAFFNRIDGYGIELLPIKGHSVKIAGHGSNNGYYSSHLDLVLSNNKDFNKSFNISECQDISY
jgi:hypothetical protein